MKKFLRYATAEFLLDKHANGGDVIFRRALWTAVLICAVALPIREVTDEHMVLRFSWNQLRIAVGQILPWFGGIFAGVYAALYTRFGSQWTYLASQYNQIMAAQVQAPGDACKERARVLTIWKAAFIEDAEDVHLAMKMSFATSISTMLKQPGVRQALAESTHGGEARVRKIEAKVACALARPYRG